MPWIDVRFDTRCSECGSGVDAGERVWYDGQMYCAECSEDIADYPDPESV